jgi:hypothetical protein
MGEPQQEMTAMVVMLVLMLTSMLICRAILGVRLKGLPPSQNCTAMFLNATAKQLNWNLGQKTKAQYRLHLEGKIAMTFPNQALSLGFEWDCLCAAWEERLRSLPTIAKSTGTAMFLPLQ